MRSGTLYGPNNVFFSFNMLKPCSMQEQQESFSSLWHLIVWFCSHSAWGLPGELINIHSHLIFMKRINTVFVWNSRGNTEHMKQQCKIRTTQWEKYTLNTFILASLRLLFIINVKSYLTWPAWGKGHKKALTWLTHGDIAFIYHKWLLHYKAFYAALSFLFCLISCKHVSDA